MVFRQWTQGEGSNIPNTHIPPLPPYFSIDSPLTVCESWRQPRMPAALLPCHSSPSQAYPGLAFSHFSQLPSNICHPGHTWLLPCSYLSCPWELDSLCHHQCQHLRIIQALYPKAISSRKPLQPPNWNKLVLFLASMAPLRLVNPEVCFLKSPFEVQAQQR